MDFPPDWEVFPAEDFTTAVPRNAGSCGMELLAQIRPNGRILDHFRVSLGGSNILNISVPLPSLLLGTPDSGLILKYAVWPRDIEIKRNMTTSQWLDITELLASKKAAIHDSEGSMLAHAAVLADISSLGSSSSIRFATVVGEDHLMQLHLQCLPASAKQLMGKPTLRG